MKKMVLVSVFLLLLFFLLFVIKYAPEVDVVDSGKESAGLWTIYNANRDVALEVADKPGEFPEGQSHPFLNGRILIAEEEAALVNIATQAEDFSEFILLLEEEDYSSIADESVEITVNCVNTSDGYECTYVVPPYDLDIALLQVSKADDKLREQCEADGGKYKCYGFCMDEYERICDFPYEDAGQPCTDNAECSGYCLADKWDCKTECTGTCATYRLNMCDNPTHLTNGAAYSESVMCD